MTRKLMPPPAHCTATSKRTGQRCKRYVMVGKSVCWAHGGRAGRNGKAEALAESDAVATIAAYVARNEHRDIGEVLIDALTVNDSVMRATRDKVARGEQVTGDDIERMIEASKTAFAIGNALARTGLMERLVRIQEAQGTMLLRCLEVALHAVELERPQREAIEAAFWVQVERAEQGAPLAEIERGRR